MASGAFWVTHRLSLWWRVFMAEMEGKGAGASRWTAFKLRSCARLRKTRAKCLAAAFPPTATTRPPCRLRAVPCPRSLSLDRQ